VERFVSLAENPFEVVAVPDGGLAASLSVTLDGATTLLPWPAGTRMLDVLIEAGAGRAVLLPAGHLRRLRLPAHRRRGGDGP
jgi:hypothetical protein